MDEKSVWRLFVMRKYKTANTTLITIQKKYEKLLDTIARIVYHHIQASK